MRYLPRLFLLLPYIAILFIPSYTFFAKSSGTTEIIFSRQTDLSIKLFTIFRVAGLYAFTLVWAQVMLGAFRLPLTRLLGTNILKLHMSSGIFTLLFAILHPLLFYVANLMSKPPISPLSALGSYLNQETILYGYLGVVAFCLMILTVTTAKLRTNRHLIRYWRYIHYSNYLIFLLVYLHSKQLGSEVGTQPLKTLYDFFGITFLIAVLYKWGYTRLWRKIKSNSQPTTTPIQNPS